MTLLTHHLDNITGGASPATHQRCSYQEFLHRYIIVIIVCNIKMYLDQASKHVLFDNS